MAWKEQQWRERAITPLFLRVSSSPHLADLKPGGLSRNISAPSYYLLLRRRKASASLVFLGWAPGDVSAGKMSAPTTRPRYLFFSFLLTLPQLQVFATLWERGIPPLRVRVWYSTGAFFLLQITRGKRTWTQTSIQFPPLSEVSGDAGQWWHHDRVDYFITEIEGWNSIRASTYRDDACTVFCCKISFDTNWYFLCFVL